MLVYSFDEQPPAQTRLGADNVVVVKVADRGGQVLLGGGLRQVLELATPVDTDDEREPTPKYYKDSLLRFLHEAQMKVSR